MDNNQGSFVNGAPHIVSNEGRGIIKNSYLISGITFVVSFMALLLCIISTALPQWGTFSYGLMDSSFGPFQQCDIITSICSRNKIATSYIVVAGAFAILAIFTLCCLVTLSAMHIMIEIQSKEMCLNYKSIIIFKLFSSVVASFLSSIACIFGCVEFVSNPRWEFYDLSVGACYYLQAVVLLLSLICIILTYMNYEETRTNKNKIRPPSTHYVRDMHRNDISNLSVTNSSRYPYFNENLHQRQPFNEKRMNEYQFQDTINQKRKYQYNKDHSQYPSDENVDYRRNRSKGYENVGFSADGLVLRPMRQSYLEMIDDIEKEFNEIDDHDLPSRPPKHDRKYKESSSYHVQPNSFPNQFDNKAFVLDVDHEQSGRHMKRSYHDDNYDGSFESMNSSNFSTIPPNYVAQETISRKPLRSSMKKKRKREGSILPSEINSRQTRFAIRNEQTNV